MINELYDLSQSLDRLDVEVVSWHRYLNECPRGKTFFVDLDAVSNVTAIREIGDPDRLKQLRKYEKAAGYSFPSFNILPLWQFDDDKHREVATKLRKALTNKKPPRSTEVSKTVFELMQHARNAWVDLNKKRTGRDRMDYVDGSLGAIAMELMNLLVDNARSYSEPTLSLIERAMAIDGQGLHKRMSEWLLNQFVGSASEWPKWFDLLFWISKTKPKLAVALELADQSAFAYPANHVQSYEFINKCLMNSTVNGGPNSLSKDAFGTLDGGRDAKFPTVKVSGFGNSVILHALNDEAKCQSRYGAIEAAAFPVGDSVRQACKNALQWISRDERIGKTWSNLSSISGAKTILFAYPTRLPEELPSLAFLINGDEDPTSMHNEVDFEACSQSIIDSLSGRVVTEEIREIVIFVLTKPDGFRTKVLYSNRCSESHIINSAREWELGCLNTPPIKSRQFGPEKGDKPQWRDPLTPFSTEIIGCLNTVWRRGGTEAATCKSARVADAMTLLLEQDAYLVRTSANLLELLLKNTTGLLLAIGQASTRGRIHKVARNLQKHQLLLPRILGLLLWKLDVKKGDYMKTPAFWVGRMLSLADQLHFQYCHQVRKGDIPPQLVGNSLMSTALHEPVHALSVLAERIKPYLAWAQTVHTGENIGLAKYFLTQLGNVSTQLADLEIPQRTNDIDRAAMLLGYLSRPEREQTISDNQGAENDHSDEN